MFSYLLILFYMEPYLCPFGKEFENLSASDGSMG